MMRSVDELIATFGPNANVRTIGRNVLKCRDKRMRREVGCPVTYQA